MERNGSGSDGDGIPRAGASTRRLTVFYVALALLTVGASVTVLHAGRDEDPQPSIAGVYEPNEPSPCLGGFSVRQSGQFANLTNQQGTIGGELRMSAGPPGPVQELTGSVRCVDGRSERFRGSIRPGARGEIVGVLGGRPFTATLRREPPEPGTPEERAPGDLEGPYALTPRSACFGGRFELSGGGSAWSVRTTDQRLGRLSYRKTTGELTGTVRCIRGGTARLSAVAIGRTLTDVTVVPVNARQDERFTATKQRELFGHLVAAFFLAAAVVMLVAQLFGWVAVRLSQPRVMGEVVAGIALGPTIFGAVAPELQGQLFPTDVLPAFGVAANLGLIFYMALVGLELDTGELRGRMSQAFAISNMSVALPMVLGLIVALPLYPLLAPDKPFAAFALFMGVAMSITAFPVLARILAERRMLRRPVGALALTCAAVDDVTAWFLIALASAVAVAGGGDEVIRTVVLAAVFCIFMIGVLRPILARVTARIESTGRVPGGWIAAIFAGILLSAYVSETIGIAVIFGAFVMGLVMPRESILTRDVTRRIEDFVVILLLPLFFAYTGLRTDIGLLDRPVLWLIGLLLLAVAILGKFVGAMVAARLTGFGWRPAAILGTLMNTRGLTELIVLNLALEKGVISDALFAMLVIMALVTTFMAGPLLRLLDPHNAYGAPVAEELREPRPATAPERSILVSPRSAEALRQLRALAEPLARTEPVREVIIAQLVRPARGVESGALQSDPEFLRSAARDVTFAQLDLIDTGIFARGVAFTSTHVAEDLLALARAEAVDLVLLDGRVRGDVATVVERAEGCVAVLVAEPAAEVAPRGDRGVLVPFGSGADDRAALDLGARLAAACSARLRVAAADDRALAEASLLAQRQEGVIVEPVPPGGEAEAIAASALVVAGMERGASRGAAVTLLVHGELPPAPRPVDGASPALALPG